MRISERVDNGVRALAGELPPDVAELAAEYRRSTEERHGARN